MKLGIIGSGKIVHDFLSIADQIPDLELAALSTTKKAIKLVLNCKKSIIFQNYIKTILTYLMMLMSILSM